MGKNESKMRKNNEKKITLSSQIGKDFSCPLCNKKFNGNMTFFQLNQHLYRCGSIHSKPGNKCKSLNIKSKNFSFNYNDSKITSETNRDKFKFNLSMNYKEQMNILSPTSTKSNKIFNLICKDIKMKNAKQNNQIGYIKANTPPQTLVGTFDERYNQLKEYFDLKKKQMNISNVISGENIKKLLLKIKECNLYLQSTFIIDNDNKFSLNDMVIKYFELMIEINKINVINGKSIAISLKNSIDFELLGYILAILLIYQECKIKYKLPQLLCKLLINEKLSLNDIQYENQELYNKLIKIKKEDDISELDIYFKCDGDDLITNGGNIKVDENNLEDYIDIMIQYEIQKYKKEIERIQDSVFQFVPKNYIFNFTGEELYQIVNKFV
jgi:hypothetical protein